MLVMILSEIKHKILYYGKLSIHRIVRIIQKLLRDLKRRLQGKDDLPRTLQLPITYACNFDCVMCGMKTKIKDQDFSVRELDAILSNPLYQEIRSVGVNGGEPFLKEDLIECSEAILTRLPKLQNIYFITNGYFTAKICAKLEKIKTMCAARQVRLHLSLSIDGSYELQDKMRGHRGAFSNMEKTLAALRANPEKYYDALNAICTITKINIDEINRTDLWFKKNGLEVAYNVATIHNRIYNYYKYQDFSVFTDEQARYLTAEFFYKKFLETKSKKYFALYLYCLDGKRHSPCEYQKEGVTLTPNGQLSYCATFSKELGDAGKTPSDIIYRNHYGYREQLIAAHCANCSQYCYSLSYHDEKQYLAELLRPARNFM